MGDVQCTLGHHLGEDVEGRCSYCGERIERPSLVLTVLVFMVVVIATVTAVQALIYWWAAT